MDVTQRLLVRPRRLLIIAATVFAATCLLSWMGDLSYVDPPGFYLFRLAIIDLPAPLLALLWVLAFLFAAVAWVWPSPSGWSLPGLVVTTLVFSSFLFGTVLHSLGPPPSVFLGLP